MAAALFRSKRRWSCFSNGRPAGAFLIVIDDLVNAEHRFPFVLAGGFAPSQLSSVTRFGLIVNVPAALVPAVPRSETVNLL